MITGTFTTTENTCGKHHDQHNRDISHLKRALQLRDLRSFLHAQNGHLSLNTTGMSTTLSKNKYDACNCGISAAFTQTAHVESAGYLPNSDVDHLFNGLQLENLYVFLNSQDHRKLYLHHDGDVDDLDTRGQCMWRCTTTGMSKTGPRAAPGKSRRSSAQFALWVHVHCSITGLHCAYLSL